MFLCTKNVKISLKIPKNFPQMIFLDSTFFPTVINILHHDVLKTQILLSGTITS